MSTGRNTGPVIGRSLSHQELGFLLQQGTISVIDYNKALNNGGILLNIPSPKKIKPKLSKNFKLAGQRNYTKRRLSGIIGLIFSLYGSPRLTLEEKEKLVQANSILREIIDKYRLGYTEIYNNNK